VSNGRTFRSCLLVALVTAGIFAAFGCSDWVGPVVPVGPVPVTPVPVDPNPVPVPVDPAKVATYAAVSSIQPGQDLATVSAALGSGPTMHTRQDDSTSIARWPCVNAAGEAKWCDVTFDAAGKVIGHVLIPRAT